MEEQQNKLKQLWEIENKTSKQSTFLPIINFNEIVNSLINIGPFYFYVVDFFDMSISNVSSSIRDIHGFDPETVSFDDVLSTIHPEDLIFVAKAEETNLKFLYEIIGKDNVMNYKSNYSFRSKLKNGEYCLLNHQAIVLTTDENGGFGKSLNIHTNISHITSKNSNTISLIGLNGNPSYTDIKVDFTSKGISSFSKREIEIIKLVSEGNTNAEIANNLNISLHTVKTHRKNINKKAACKNVSELINKFTSNGLL
ncbi:LuxR C-terminal-related transcriptional regulator [Flavobacterium gelidilacus]|jgi:DNA-binding CsgD family transcriptional regulator|uniref:LuxR C-terminal-related transcriptional regulator n=1 Tax=Flavobacterium gelidilacus TaxID=206041 RepID=UPI0004027C6B|nr:LuxR C-terminal-related transcriptional regulator [Flavobacterium gelidilacus]